MKTLVVYLMAMPDTPALAQAAVEAGADVLEIGFPFSDAYGWERLERDARAAGATSFIVVDLPADVRPELRRVQLVAPTSTDDRLRLAASSTDGWLYLVTVTGTTGARTELAPTLAPLAERVRAVTDEPLYAGLGI